MFMANAKKQRILIFPDFDTNHTKEVVLAISHPDMTNAVFSQPHWNARCINDVSYKEQRNNFQPINKPI